MHITKEFTPVNNAISSYDIAFEELLYPYYEVGISLITI